MSGSFRRILLATWIAFHAAITLCGPGLHALSGFEHDGSPGAAADDGLTIESGDTLHGEADDCPVCHYLAQGQLPCQNAPVVVDSAVVHLAQSRREPTLPLALHLPSSPRAPPPPALTHDQI